MKIVMNRFSIALALAALLSAWSVKSLAQVYCNYQSTDCENISDCGLNGAGANLPCAAAFPNPLNCMIVPVAPKRTVQDFPADTVPGTRNYMCSGQMNIRTTSRCANVIGELAVGMGCTTLAGVAGSQLGDVNCVQVP